MKSVHINVNLSISGWPITGTIECEFTPCPPTVPLPPVFKSINGSKGPTMLRTFTTQLKLVDPTVTSVPCTAAFSDGTPPQTFDVFLNQTFTAEDGTTITLTGTQVNSAGPSPPAVPVMFIAASGVVPPVPPVPPQVPVAPEFVSITGTP